MSRGGTREGAGRKRGSKSRSRLEIESRLEKLDCDPIEALVVISKDMTIGADTRARVLIELASYCHAKRRPEAARRAINLDGALTLEGQGRQVLAALGRAELTPEEAALLLNGLGRQAQVEQLGVIADIVAALAARSGLPVPPELQVRQRIPATINAPKPTGGPL